MHTARIRVACSLAAIAAALCAQVARAEIAVPEGARAEAAFVDGEPRVEARLLVHPDDDPSRGSLRLGVLIDIAPGWHIYWKQPGDSGIPTRVAWHVDGAETEPVAWPPPRVFREAEGELVTYGYAERVLLSATASFAATPPDAPVARAEVSLLACRLQCVPGSFSLRRVLGGPPDAPLASVRALFEESEATPPRPDGGAHRDPIGLARALGLALLGGLLLNLMPCVLPVLAIKLFALAELARAGKRRALAHAAAYTGGILAAMLALAGAVVALQAAGRSVGWGFQFQEPLFVAALAALLVVFALNLFGVFEIGVDTARLAAIGEGATGARRSFFEGLLAVALATPCSAPFLGTAVGFAFASPAPVIAGIFACVGLGLAAPFALAALVPSSTRWLPRSGAWMLRLRTLLGFTLLASVVWLLWIASRSLDGDALVALLAFLLAVAFAAWLYGALQASASALWTPGRAGLALLAVAALGLGAVGVERDEAGLRAAPAWSREAVAAQLDAGRPVFAYFTADWCLTCKLNEHTLLADPRVADAFERNDVAVLAGDWTRGDSAITAELARFGRAGVPLYVVYRPHAPDEPLVLPEIPSVERILEAIRAAVPAAGRVTAVTHPEARPSITGPDADAS